MEYALMNPSDKQINNNPKPWLWKKGQSGNVMGRPKGKTMKEYVKSYLERMSDEERDEWLEGIPKEIIWKLAEGMPQTNADITSGGKPLIEISESIAKKHGIASSTESNS